MALVLQIVICRDDETAFKRNIKNCGILAIVLYYIL